MIHIVVVKIWAPTFGDFCWTTLRWLRLKQPAVQFDLTLCLFNLWTWFGTESFGFFASSLSLRAAALCGAASFCISDFVNLFWDQIGSSLVHQIMFLKHQATLSPCKTVEGPRPPWYWLSLPCSGETCPPLKMTFICCLEAAVAWWNSFILSV